MLKNRNKWFYAFIVAAVLLVAAAVVIVAISAKPETPQGEVNTPEEGAETGVYYYGVEQGDIILSLNSGNKFTIAGTNLNKSGTYTVDGETLVLDFIRDVTVEFVISTLCHVFICACGGLPLNGIVITVLFVIYALMYFIWINNKIQAKQFEVKKLAIFFCLILILAIFALVIGKLTLVHNSMIINA